jgi:hypothetical protein
MFGRNIIKNRAITTHEVFISSSDDNIPHIYSLNPLKKGNISSNSFINNTTTPFFENFKKIYFDQPNKLQSDEDLSSINYLQTQHKL